MAESLDQSISRHGLGQWRRGTANAKYRIGALWHMLLAGRCSSSSGGGGVVILAQSGTVDEVHMKSSDPTSFLYGSEQGVAWLRDRENTPIPASYVSNDGAPGKGKGKVRRVRQRRAGQTKSRERVQ